MRKMFENKVYGNGDGILVFKKDNKVICVGRVVLKEIPLTGIAYIHFLDILESLPNKKEVIKEMINECYKKAEEYNANKILLGFRKKETTEMLHKIGFDADYAAKIMTVQDTTIKGKQGTFDIGLSSKFRGKGYGKRLLETAIDFLESKDIENVYLIVIETNKIAYKMYKKRGFKEDKVLSYWISLK